MSEEKQAKARARLEKAVAAYIKASGFVFLSIHIGEPRVAENAGEHAHVIPVDFVGKKGE